MSLENPAPAQFPEAGFGPDNASLRRLLRELPLLSPQLGTGVPSLEAAAGDPDAYLGGELRSAALLRLSHGNSHLYHRNGRGEFLLLGPPCGEPGYAQTRRALMEAARLILEEVCRLDASAAELEPLEWENDPNAPSVKNSTRLLTADELETIRRQNPSLEDEEE